MNTMIILLSGGLLVNSHVIDKTQMEQITGQKYVIQGSIPVIAKNEITGIAIAKKEKNVKNAKKLPSKSKKKVVSKKKISSKKHKIKSKNVKKVQKTKKYKSKKKKTKSRKNSVLYKQTTYIKYDKSVIQSYAHNLVLSYGWSEYDFECLVKLWNRESSWNPNAVNRRSGACGIPQSLPCNKMASFGKDYRINYKTQIKWGLNYIKKRYGTPANAWNHSQRKGWY